MTGPADVETSWDHEYGRGRRYVAEPPLDFVEEIIRAVRRAKLETEQGLYIGCGNGRNYIPLTKAGLNIVGLDVSSLALQQLCERVPTLSCPLIHGDLSALPDGSKYAYVIGIQVFQHGTRGEAHSNINQALKWVAIEGLFCLRVNSTATDIVVKHEVMEKSPDLGFTVRYLEGSKSGLIVHFFDEKEILGLMPSHFQPVSPLRIVRRCGRIDSGISFGIPDLISK